LSAVRRIENIAYIWTVELINRHIYESVFVQSLSGNVVVSNEERTTGSTHSCIDYAVEGHRLFQFLISILVWSTVSSYLLQGSTTASWQIDEQASRLNRWTFNILLIIKLYIQSSL